MRLHHYNQPTQSLTANIPPTGDQLRERHENNPYTQFGFQNIRGSIIDCGLEIATKIDRIINIGTTIQGLSETNRPWNHTNKLKYDFMIESVFQQAHTVYASSPTEQTTKYQPGGNLLSTTCNNVGRVSKTGHDSMGQYAWATMQSKQDKGILVIVAYRVCQDRNSKAGAFTAYQQQCTTLHSQGGGTLDESQESAPSQ